MTARTAGRKGRPWRRLCAQVYATETHCIRCGRYVDQTLPPRTPQSRSVDHKVPLAQGGQPLDRRNVGLAHLGCNSRAGAHLRWMRADHTAAPDASPQLTTSEDW
ncbi:HNH endonuclease [Micromonospora aurantiaca (nom. illeg.)]|uniref:HNH endonuclease n=1 Tax=Micromonospora aurantiaca (nom. illeg.) TaxID=47850 RepID=UPI003405D12D